MDENITNEKVCSKCGTKNTSEAMFCNNCGNSFQVVSEEPVVTETLANQPVEAPAKTPTETVVTPEVTSTPVVEEKPKKKKGKGCLIALIVILLIAAAITAVVFLIKKANFFEDPFTSIDELDGIVTKSNVGKLEEDLSSGKITKDQYIMQMAYSLNEPNMVSDDYKSLSNKADMNYLLQKANENVDNLSDETILYLYKMISLSNMKWVVPEKESNNETGKITYLAETNGRSLNELNQVKLSRDGHFLVYYTTEGKNAISNSKAKKVANYLEDVVSYYKKEYGYDFQYNITYNTKVFSTEILTDMTNTSAALLLVQNGIDVSYMQKAMPIYIIDTDYEHTNILGWNCADINIYGQMALRMLNITEDNILYDSAISTYAFPYTVISTTVFDQFDNAKIVIGHELFHHYQHYICGDGSYAMCNSGLFTVETTADLGALKASGIKKNVELLNDHATWYISGVEQSIDKLYYPELGEASVGYGAYIFAYNYANIVHKGLNTLSLSGKSKQPLKFLEENSYGKFGEVMETMAEKNLTRDYDNKSLMAYDNGEPVYPKPREILGTPTDDDKFYTLCRKTEPASINYYYINTANYTKKDYFVIGPNNISSHKFDSGTVILFVKEKGSYKKVLSSNKSFVLNIDDFGYYDEIAIAVVGTKTDYGQQYEIQIVRSDEVPSYFKDRLITAKELGLKTKDQKKSNLRNAKKVATNKLECVQKEESELYATYNQVLVKYNNKDEVVDMYVRATIKFKNYDENNPAFKIAKGLTTGVAFLIKQKYKEQFGKISLTTKDEGERYVITARVKGDYYYALQQNFNTQLTTKEEIFKAIEEEGYTCKYTY